MNNLTEKKTVLISKWARAKEGAMLKQVVVKTEAGKTVKGKTAYRSQTRHVPV